LNQSPTLRVDQLTLHNFRCFAECIPSVETFPVNTSGSAFGSEIERVCVDNELVIATWSPIHLRTKLKELYWKADKAATGAMAFWEDTMRYLYLPRLKSRDVLAQAIIKGAVSRDFFGTAYGEHEGKFDGFKLGNASVQLDDTLLLIEPEAASAYEEANQSKPGPGPQTPTGLIPSGPFRPGSIPPGPISPSPVPTGTPRARMFHGMADIPAATAKMRLVQLAEEVISVLASDPNAQVKVTVEMSAEFPNGATDQVKRAVSENAKSLNLRNADWE
jgi:hypothetical protein